MDFQVETLVLILTALLLLYKLATRNLDYWAKRKVPYIKPYPVFGNFLPVLSFKKCVGDYLNEVYKQMDYPFFGFYIFTTPSLIIKSPELVKQILVKDFNIFSDRAIANSKHDPISSEMLFLNKSPRWKKIRTKLTPVFTSGKLRNMYPLIDNVGLEMRKFLKRIPNKESLEAKEVCSKFSTDVIAKCAFAINAHSFEYEDAEFREVGRKMFGFSYWLGFSQTCYFFVPSLVKWLRLKVFPKEVLDFLANTFWMAIKQREQHQVVGNDLIDIINEIKKDEQFVKEVDFVEEKVVAQAAQFFAAGFETTSSTMGFALYEFCINPDIQKKVREEMKLKLKDKNITYDSLKELTYLDKCIHETLRKYPVLPFLDRKCNSDYKIPGSDVVLEKGTTIYIPMMGLHFDEEYFPEPEKFNPDRFDNPADINAKGLSYIPFGDGPRNCIGARFGFIGTKAGLVHILLDYEIEKSSKTPVPLQFDPKSFTLASKVGLPMNFKFAPLF